MRRIGGAVIVVTLSTLFLAACAGGSAATSTPPPAPTSAAAAQASPVAGSSASGTTACPTTPPPAPTSAAGPPPRTSGTIAAINGTAFTVTQRDNKTVTVATDATTQYRTYTLSSIGAIKVGDVIVVQGPATGSTVAATAIIDSGAPAPRPTLPPGCVPATRAPQPTPQASRPAASSTAIGGNSVTGTVTAVNGTTLTMNGRSGTTTVTTVGSTTVTGRRQGTFADLRVGDQVTANAARGSGTTAGGSGFTAVAVNDQTAR